MSIRTLFGTFLIGMSFGTFLSLVMSGMNRNLETLVQDTEQVQKGGWVKPDRVYGHIHIAKTAGTTINGELASKYDRVCGHKGYSYDSYQHNLRRKHNNNEDPTDSISRQYPHYDRGRVPLNVMDEIGYENCDWISQEYPMQFWKRFDQSGWKLELHVSCRDPLEHLMSQCHYSNKIFDCNGDWEKQVKECLVFPDRFSYNVPLISDHRLKCFDPIPASRYVNYMGEILQRKRIETEYSFVSTNLKREKKEECIWKLSTDEQEKLKSVLRKWDLYDFCDKCMGTENELPLPVTNEIFTDLNPASGVNVNN